MTNERKAVTAAYESLNTANTAMFRIIVELAVLLLKNQAANIKESKEK